MKPAPETTGTTWTPLEDLEWTAFRYVANELPDAEIAAFEKRLADDQVAREAVARCVCLTHSVVAIEEVRETVPASPGHNKRPGKRWWIVAALTAAVAIVAAFWIGTTFPQQQPDDSRGNLAGRQQTPDGPPSVANPNPKTNGADPSDVIATWLNFDPAAALDSGLTANGSASQDSLAKTSDPAEGSFNWVVAAVDDSPLAVPVLPEKSPKERK